MNRSLSSTVAATVLAIGTLAAAAGAHAGPAVHVSINVPAATPVHVHPQPVQVAHQVHVPAYEVYEAPHAYGHERRHRGEHSWRDARRAPRWDPHVRYLPGQVVRRHGDLFVAKGVSARVWNVNSPPEWTPQYWARADRH